MKNLILVLSISVMCFSIPVKSQAQSYLPDRFHFVTEAYEITYGGMTYFANPTGYFPTYIFTGDKVSVGFTMYVYITGAPVFIITQVNGERYNALPLRIPDEDFKLRPTGDTSKDDWIRIGATHQFNYNGKLYFISLQ